MPCCFDQDRPKMEPAGDHFAEGAEGSLKQLASKWFIETQVPLIVNNGLFPSWFLGFISRQWVFFSLHKYEKMSYICYKCGLKSVIIRDNVNKWNKCYQNDMEKHIWRIICVFAENPRKFSEKKSWDLSWYVSVIRLLDTYCHISK